MTGLHYKVRELKSLNGMRAFNVHRSDQTFADNVTVFLDSDGVTHCGSCRNRWVSMRRNCTHCDVVHRYVASHP